jgi:hypothetical protein
MIFLIGKNKYKLAQRRWKKSGKYSIEGLFGHSEVEAGWSWVQGQPELLK